MSDGMTGHQEALREWRGDDIGWQYSDPDNDAFCVALMLHGVNLVALDAFIESLEVEGAPASAELRERRRNALRLFKARRGGPLVPADEAWSGHIEWILLRKSAIERSDLARPYIADGRRKREADRKRTANLVRLKQHEAAANAERDKQIYANVTDLQSRGVPGAAAKVARKYQLSTSRVNNIVSKMREKK